MTSVGTDTGFAFQYPQQYLSASRERWRRASAAGTASPAPA